MKILFLLALVLLFTIQCSSKKKVDELGKPSVKQMQSSIREMDDSLKVLYNLVRENKINEIHSLNFMEAINRYLAFYHAYPKNQFSAECLDKAQQLYTQLKSYETALAYSDTLLEKYPNYNKKGIILLNAGSIADGILNDTTLTRIYYTRLIKEVPKLDKETSDMVRFRLKYLHLSFDEMADMQMKLVSGK